MNRFIKNATVNSGREGRICERPKMIGWSLSQAGAPEMGISEEGASSLLHGTALTDNTLVCLLFTAGHPTRTMHGGRGACVRLLELPQCLGLGAKHGAEVVLKV